MKLNVTLSEDSSDLAIIYAKEAGCSVEALLSSLLFALHQTGVPRHFVVVSE